MNAPANDPLFQPLKIKHLTLKNRIMSTSHAISYGENGMPTERYQRYHEEKARGGIGLTMFGGSSVVAPDSPSVFGQLDVGRDEIIPYFRQFAERVQRHGSALMCQITHMGRRTSAQAGDWLPIVAPSAVREPLHRGIPKEMDRHDIARIVKAYGAGARRCKEGGLDGCEVIASGHLLDQFWSPAVNKRTDEFGGSLANRMRFGMMVFEEIRRQVGDDFLVGVRMTMSEGFEGGMSEEECLEIAKTHTDSGLLDFLNLVQGRIDTEAGLATYMPGMAIPLGPYLEAAGRFKRAVSLPVFHATRIADIATARHAIREGHLDMVAMTRAHIADPHIAAKIARGEENRIRPCVGATYCSDHRLCIHNPATGREDSMPHVIAKSEGARKKIVVVGGGPGGLEAARVSAERGHDVVLFEAAAELGGQVLLAARGGWRRDIIGIVDWRVAELEHLGIRVVMNCLAGDDTVAAETPDVVIVATGGLPDLEWLEGHDRCHSVWDVLGGSVQLSGDVLLYDGVNRNQGASCAAHLADKDLKLEMVTRDHMSAQQAGYLNIPFYLRDFYRAGVVMTPDRRLSGVEWMNGKLRAVLVNEYSDQEEERIVDHVIVEHGTKPLDGLYHDLRGGSRNDGVTDIDALLAGRPQPEDLNPDGAYQLFRIGDAVASRDIHGAIFDALRLCKDL